MSRLLSLKIDVTKIDKARIFEGAKGKYIDLDVWINDDTDQYGNHASVSHQQTKEERDAKAKKIYLGNGKKVFGWDDDEMPSQSRNTVAGSTTTHQMAGADEVDDVPF